MLGDYMKLCFATSNKDKIGEFRDFLLPRGIEVEGIDLDIPEIRDGDPAKIAVEKARYASEKTGKTVLAEDSGLFVDALKGFPGVYSAYAYKTIGLKGILKLMEDEEDRRAKFISAVALAEPGKEPKVFVGEEHGTLTRELRGTKGFGYDPILIPDGYEKTHAEDIEIKRKESHRVRALTKLVGFLGK